MPRYQVQEDEFVEAQDAADLVAYLARTSYAPVAGPKEFRERAAHYAKLLYGATIRVESDEAFVTDMLSAGIYRIHAVQ